MTNTISVTEARNNFADIISRVQYNGETFIVEKQGKVVARITSVEVGQIKKSQHMTPPVFAMGGADTVYSRDEIYE